VQLAWLAEWLVHYLQSAMNVFKKKKKITKLKRNQFKQLVD
jgi:hypothetical protein